MKSSLVIYFLSISFILSCCKKEELPELRTVSITEITINSAVGGGDIISDGGADVLARGVCWSENTNPTLDDKISSSGAGNGIFTTNITGLQPGKKYYVRAYATNSVGTSYGEEINFNTLGSPPQISDVSAAYFRLYGAVLQGYVNSGDLPTLVSFEYGLTASYGSLAVPSPYPFTGSSPIGISVRLDNLSPGTLYHFRIKSENELGVFYSGDNTFSTLGEKPSLTGIIQSLTATGAIIGINVNANLLPIFVELEYGLTESLGKSVISSGSPITQTQLSIVSTSISNLAPSTKYFFRIKLTNEVGSVYTAISNFTTYRLMDVDNNGYYSAMIGTQEWLTSNLKATHFSNGDPVPNVNDNWTSQTAAAYCYYTYQASPLEGNLYNFYVAVDGRNVCPSGWHVPGKDDWTKLIDHLGGISVAGPELRHSSSDFWYPTTVSTNSSGFSAVGAGSRLATGEYWGWHHAGIFWTTTDFIDPAYKYRMIIYGDRPEVELSSDIPVSGYSIRCLKN